MPEVPGVETGAQKENREDRRAACELETQRSLSRRRGTCFMLAPSAQRRGILAISVVFCAPGEQRGRRSYATGVEARGVGKSEATKAWADWQKKEQPTIEKMKEY